MPQLEAAFNVVPSTRRDSWRVHRVEPGDTFAAIARRYNTTTAQISSANADALPETGQLVAVPVAYPGERVPGRPAAKAPVKLMAKASPRPSVHIGSGATAGAPTGSHTAVSHAPVSHTGVSSTQSGAAHTASKWPAASSLKAAPHTPAAQKSAAKPPGKAAPVNGAMNRTHAPASAAARARSTAHSTSVPVHSASAAHKVTAKSGAHRASGA
jgi:LysM repeat protein